MGCSLASTSFLHSSQLQFSKFLLCSFKVKHPKPPQNIPNVTSKEECATALCFSEPRKHVQIGVSRAPINQCSRKSQIRQKGCSEGTHKPGMQRGLPSGLPNCWEISREGLCLQLPQRTAEAHRPRALLPHKPHVPMASRQLEHGSIVSPKVSLAAA